MKKCMTWASPYSADSGQNKLSVVTRTDCVSPHEYHPQTQNMYIRTEGKSNATEGASLDQNSKYTCKNLPVSNSVKDVKSLA
jgi:hypothetical protein